MDTGKVGQSDHQRIRVATQTSLVICGGSWTSVPGAGRND